MVAIAYLPVQYCDYKFQNFSYADQRFRRCLNEQLGLTISDIDHEYLVHKYGQEKPGMINYKAFEEAMEKSMLIRLSFIIGVNVSIISSR